MFGHHIVLTSIKAAQRLDEQIEGCVSDSRIEGCISDSRIEGCVSDSRMNQGLSLRYTVHLVPA